MNTPVIRYSTSEQVWRPDIETGFDQVLLGEEYALVHEMKNVCCCDGIGVGLSQPLSQVLPAADAAAGDHRNADAVGHLDDEVEVVAAAHAVAVDRVEQDFAGAEAA